MGIHSAMRLVKSYYRYIYPSITAVYIFLFLFGSVFWTLSTGLISAAFESSHSQQAFGSSIMDGINLRDIDMQLRTVGMRGVLHGAVHDRHQYVITYRAPDDFFTNIQFSVIGGNNGVLKILQELNRHDEVVIQGHLLQHASRQPHIWVTSVEIVKQWRLGQVSSSEFTYFPEQTLKEVLSQNDELVAMVHAVPFKGNVVVLEYKDGIIPLVVNGEPFTRNLWRGDIVKVRYRVQNYPEMPPHIILDTCVADEGKKSLEILDQVQNLHGREMTIEGVLVLFPQSPMLNRDVWALEQRGLNGLTRYFTLFNFDDAADQEQVDRKLRSWWSQAKGSVIDGRNKLINPDIYIRAKGVANAVDPNQANLQLILESKNIERLEPMEE